MVPTTDGKEMTTWVVYPPKFDKTKRYPSILYCQGGPQQAVKLRRIYNPSSHLFTVGGRHHDLLNRRHIELVKYLLVYRSKLGELAVFQATTAARI